jgi:hypothetical protein
MPHMAQRDLEQALEEHSRSGSRRARESDGAGAGGALVNPPVWNKVAGGLGWFSIGLGLTELLAPRELARSIGAPARTQLIRAMGLREIMAGLGILLGRNTRVWVQSRVAGDMIDLALLGAAYRARRAKRANLAVATAAVAGVTALDVLCAARLAQAAPLSSTKSVAVM